MSKKSYKALHDEFVEQHRLSYPLPDKPKKISLSWQFWVSLIWAVSAVLMMSIATAYEFYASRLVSGMGIYLAAVAAFFSMFSVEGGMVFGAALYAARKSVEELRIETKILISVVACLGISVVAGTNAVLGVIPDISTVAIFWSRVALVIATGAFGSVIVWSSGEVLGSELNKVLTARQQAKITYQRRKEQWLEHLNNRWTSSPQYKIAMAEVRSEAKELKKQTPTPLPATTSPPANTPVDWRRLTDEDKRWVHEHTEAEVQKRWNLISKTAGNWKTYADKMFSGKVS